MNAREIGGWVVGTAAAAAAAETHLASVEVIKYIAALATATYAVGKIVRAAMDWGNKRVREAVREEIQAHCAAARGERSVPFCESSEGGE